MEPAPVVIQVSVIGYAFVKDARSKEYVVYIIDIQQGGIAWQIFRRFASFVALNDVFLEQRRGALERWIQQLLMVPDVCAMAEFQHFLQAEANVPPPGIGIPVISSARHAHGESWDAALPAEEKADGVGREGGAARPRMPRARVDDFALIRVIGKGSFGKVLLVRERSSGKMYAMKVLRKNTVLRRNQLEHTMTERAVLGQLHHPFLVALRYAFQNKEKLFFVIDYCAGGELFFHLGREGRFTEARARFYAAEIVLALNYMHQRHIVYRDLKPENVLLDADGHIKLTDFGLSKEGITEVDHGATSFCGTPEYLAPEVLDRRGHGRAVDWWALGALLYEMMTGLPPFYSRDREEMFHNIRYAKLRLPRSLTPEAKSILRGMLTRNPLQRLGCGETDAQEVMTHPFFASVDWRALEAKRVPAPWQPPVRGSLDTSMFSSEFTGLPLSSPATSSLPEDAAQAFRMEDFTYVRSLGRSLQQHMMQHQHHQQQPSPQPSRHRQGAVAGADERRHREAELAAQAAMGAATMHHHHHHHHHHHPPPHHPHHGSATAAVTVMTAGASEATLEGSWWGSRASLGEDETSSQEPSDGVSTESAHTRVASVETKHSESTPATAGTGTRPAAAAATSAAAHAAMAVARAHPAAAAAWPPPSAATVPHGPLFQGGIGCAAPGMAVEEDFDGPASLLEHAHQEAKWADTMQHTANGGIDVEEEDEEDEYETGSAEDYEDEDAEGHLDEGDHGYGFSTANI